MLPLGRLSPSSAPILTADTTSSTLYYTDSETVITLDISTLAVGQYDVYLIGGALVVSSFNSAVVHGGAWVNGTAFTGCPQYAGEYLGAINVRVAGHVTCHVSYGQNRAWDVWNSNNQREVVLKAGGAARYQQIVPPGGGLVVQNWTPMDVNNCLTFFAGQPVGAHFEIEQAINTKAPPGGSAWGMSGVGYGSTTAAVGFDAVFGVDDGIIVGGNGFAPGSSVAMDYDAPPASGAVNVTQLIWAMGIASATQPAQVTFFGANEGNQIMTGRWMG